MAEKKPRVSSGGMKNNPAKADIAFGKIIREYRQRAGMEQEQIGRACNLTPNTVSNWERGISRPDLALVPTLCELLQIPLKVFFGMPDDSLLTDTEQMIINDYRRMTKPNRVQLNQIINAIMESQDATRRDLLRSSYVPRRSYEYGLSAGFGAPLEDEADTKILFVRNSKTARRADGIFPVNGHSMEPTFPDGSKVFVEHMNFGELSDGDIIACVVGGTPFLKIYEKDGLHSINPEYDTITVHEDDHFYLIGRVLGSVPEEDIATEEQAAELMEIFAEE